MRILDSFKEIWFCDFEFKADSGERPVVHCMVASELRTGRVLKLWADELGGRPPFSVGPDSLFVAYYASAELGCFLTLGWPMPQRILDLYVEFRRHTNGLPLASGNGLLGALVHHGIDSMAAAEKTEMRDLAIRGGPFTSHEKTSLLDYCESDVVALPKLLEAMAPRIDLGRALLRGRYMAAVAHMEHTGTPIDQETLHLLRSNWGKIKGELISRVDSRYGIYDDGTFKHERFADWLKSNNIPWASATCAALAFLAFCLLSPKLATDRTLVLLGDLSLVSLVFLFRAMKTRNLYELQGNWWLIGVLLLLLAGAAQTMYIGPCIHDAVSDLVS